MDNGSTTLRPAEPTEDDGLAFARYLNEAAEGFFRLLLGRNANRIIAAAFAETDHDLSFQNVTFAERDNVIVGMVSGYTAEQHRRSSRYPLKRAAGRWNLRMRILFVVFAPLMRIIDSMSESDFYLQAIAIDKELRGSGNGSILMHFVEERARSSGATRLTLDVSAKNDAARRFYEHHEMKTVSQWPRHWRIPALKFYRMTKMI